MENSFFSFFANEFHKTSYNVNPTPFPYLDLSLALQAYGAWICHWPFRHMGSKLQVYLLTTSPSNLRTS